MSRDSNIRARIRTPAISFFGVQLTARGWAFVVFAAVALIAAYAGGRQELLYVGVLLAVLPVVAIVSVRMRRPRLTAARTFTPQVMQAGSSATVALTVHNLSGGRSARALWWDVLPWHPGETETGTLPVLEARGRRFVGRNSVTVSYELRPPHRGIFPVGPMGIEVGDPFGLATSELRIGVSQPMIVTPEVVPLAETGLSLPAGDGESRLVQRRASGDDDDAMTREYRTGDAMRRVHWRATARHGDLMVRQEEQRSFPEARLIVDTMHAGYRDATSDEAQDAESPAFEWTVRMLASVAMHLRRNGFLVTIEETGAAQLDAVSRGRRRAWGDEEFLGALATLGLTDTPASRRGAATSRQARGSTATAAAPAARSWASGDAGSQQPNRPDEPSTERRGRDGSGPIFAIVGESDPETTEWMLRQRRPGDLAVAFLVRSVSALDVLERSLGVAGAPPPLAERLADAGWLVVPVRADDDHAAAWQAVVTETSRARGSG